MRCKNCGRADIPDGSTFCNFCGKRLIAKPKNEINVPKARQMTSGNWYINMRIGGQSINVTEPTEAKCIAKARAIKAGMLEAEKSSRKTLANAVEDYIKNREAVLSPSTVKAYRSVARSCFQAAMNKPVDYYTQEGWQRLVSAESKRCSPKTLKNAWTLINAAIAEELGKGHTVRLPQVVPTREAKFFEPSELRIFCDAIKGHKVEVAALLGLHSLRRSELLAVRWEDVDFDKRLIKVRGAVVYNDSGELVEKATTKNKSSRREVPIMMERLYELLLEQRQPSGRIVTLHPNSVGKMINAICKSNGLPEVGVHGLRHSFASTAARIGMPEKNTMEIGGWQNDATMKRIYTHALQEDRKAYQEKMTNYFNQAPPQ